MNKDRNLRVVSSNNQDQIDINRSKEDDKGRLIAAVMIGATALALGGAGNAVFGNGGNQVALKAPAPKLSTLTNEQASRTSLGSTEVVSPLQADEVAELPTVNVTAEPGDGAFSLTKRVDGSIENTNLMDMIEREAQHVADEVTGGFKVGDTYPIAVLPEQYIGEGHMQIPEDVAAELNSFEEASDLPVNPAAVDSSAHNS